MEDFQYRHYSYDVRFACAENQLFDMPVFRDTLNKQCDRARTATVATVLPTNTRGRVPPTGRRAETIQRFRRRPGDVPCNRKPMSCTHGLRRVCACVRTAVTCGRLIAKLLPTVIKRTRKLIDRHAFVIHEHARGRNNLFIVVHKLYRRPTCVRGLTYL